MSLKIRHNRIALRVVLLELDEANLHKNLQLVLDEDISGDRNVAVRSPILA